MGDLYIFLDESGNDDFSPTGSKYLVLTSLTTNEPLALVMELYSLKHEICRSDLDLSRFHAASDKQRVRDKVFRLVSSCSHFRVDSLVVEKAKAHPSIASYLEIYPRMCFYLLRYVLNNFALAANDHLFIFMDYLAVKGKRQALIKGIKEAIWPLLRNLGRYSIHQHRSESHPYLQVVDHYCWAIYRKWESGDSRSYNLIKHQVASEFDLFRHGTQRFY